MGNPGQTPGYQIPSGQAMLPWDANPVLGEGKTDLLFMGVTNVKSYKALKHLREPLLVSRHGFIWSNLLNYSLSALAHQLPKQPQESNSFQVV